MAHLDGKPVLTDDVLPLALTGYGHFTTMRVDADHRIRGVSLHMDRLVADCRTVWGADLDTGRVRRFVRQALAGHRGPCVVRATIYDPAVDVAHPADADQPRVLVTVRPAGAMPPPPLRARSVPYERDLPQVKHCGLFGALHVRRAAQVAGFDDALLVGPDGHVSEGPTWNVGFIADDGTVVWPQAPVLPGVTMRLLQQRVEHRITPVTLDRAKGMRAAFATNTSIGVRALAAIDDASLAVEDPVLSTLREAYLSVPGEEL
ncbi:aminotransferase class IV family protein [Streptomyces sp. NPDC021749]|uniref:aminotransferase class IV family protein n=1 Tax=Streptomyces sp. NPDC021749 TaxID=3154905 RepID=UPI003411D85E